MTEKFQQNYSRLLKKYNSLGLEAKNAAGELDILEGSFASRRHNGINILPYFKIGNKENSKVFVLLIDLAYDMASDTTGVLSDSARKKYILEYFNTKYNRVSIGKKAFANELRIHINTLGSYMKKNHICSYKKNGKSHNAKVTFNTYDIIDFFAIPIKTIDS